MHAASPANFDASFGVSHHGLSTPDALPRPEDLARTLHLACQDVVAALLRLQGTLCLAESCTGGLVAAALTALPGVSRVFYGSIVAYSNAAKQTLLGVPETVLDQHGATSAPVALCMAQGALQAFGPQPPGSAGSLWALAFTGHAGPSAAHSMQPVGRIFGAVACAGQAYSWAEHFEGSREQVRLQAALRGVKSLLAALAAL
jgi:PncC family amidohydrolase